MPVFSAVCSAAFAFLFALLCAFGFDWLAYREVAFGVDVVLFASLQCAGHACMSRDRAAHVAVKL